MTLLILLALGASAFFAASEIALVSVSRVRLRHWVGRRVRGARLAADFLERPQRLLGSIVVGNNLAHTSVTVLVSALLVRLLPIDQAGPLAGALLLPALIAPPLLLFGELLPKALAREHASAILPLLAWPLEGIARLLHPLVVVVLVASRALLRVLGVAPREPERYFSRRNIEELLREAAQEGIAQPKERQIISGVLSFGESMVREVMTPRTAIVAVDRQGMVEEISRVMRESGYSRIPIYQGTLDQIVGMLHVFDLLKHEEGDELTPRPLVFAPATKRCDELLYEMKEKRCHMAIILDEYGGTAGLVTLDDLFEELVGDIGEGHGAEGRLQASSGERALLVDGRTEVEWVNKRLGLSLDTRRAETIGGLLAHLLGRIPQAGEVLRMGRLRIEIVEAQPTRVEKVLLTAVPPEEIDRVMR